MYAITRTIGRAEITLVSTKEDVIERVIDFESVVSLVRLRLTYNVPTTAQQLLSIVQDIIRRYEEYHEGLEIGMRATKVRLLSNASTEQRLLDNGSVSARYPDEIEHDNEIHHMVPSE